MDGIAFMPVACCLGREKKLTVGRPADGGARDGGSILVNLEPNGASAIERGSRAGSPCEVDIDWARVGKARVGGEGDAGAGRHGKGLRRRGAGTKLVARHLRRRDVGHGAIGIVVLGAPRVLPVAAGNAARGDAGDGVCDARVSVHIMKSAACAGRLQTVRGGQATEGQ